MGGGSKKQTVGYRYYLGEHLVFCHGPVDKFKRLTFDSTRIAWEGFLAARGSISVQANMIFGGEDIGREGGVSGTLNFEPGEPDQPQNSYLQARLGTDIPAFRGVTALVFNQMYLGTSPYMKKVSARFTRIMKTTGGATQWYPSKAAVGTIADQPLALYFAIDISGSMDDLTSNGQTRLQNMKTALKAVLDFIDANAVQDPNAESIDIFFSAFGTQPSTRQTISRFDVDSTDIQDLKDWIDARTASLWTYFPAGVMDAQQFFNVDCNPAALKKLFFITDGEPSTSDSSQTPTQIAQAAHDLILAFDFDFTFTGGGFFGFVPGISFVIPGLEAYGINIDLPDTTYTAYCDNTPGDGVPVIDGADPTALVNAIASAFTGQEDMNPAHIIRECLTDNLWGMGYNAGDMDDDAFEAAADQLHAEGFGISILWDQQMPIEQFVGEIIKHIDASLYVDRRTGKFVLKLIRGGYDLGSLPLFDESNIDKIEGFTRPTFGELTNSVTVNYWDATTGKTASLTIEDPALILMQGAVINTTLQYPGITNALMAARVASRDLKTLSNPLASCTIYANSDAEDLNIGSVVRFSWAEYGIVNMPMRVSGIGWGDGVSNKVKMQVAQDVFALPETAVVIPPGTGWTDPNQPPGPVQRRSVQEMSYYEMYQLFGEADLTSKLTSAPNTGRLAITGARPTDTALNASLSIDAGAGYESANVVDFCPAAQLTHAVTRGDDSAATETWTLDNWIDEANVQVGTSASIGTEKVYIVSKTGNDIEVKRGVLDTVPQAHADNTWLLFDDVFISNDGVDYTASDVVNVKMLTATGDATLDPQYAPVDTVTFASRAYKPYPPGNWKINDENFPEDVSLTLNNTWVTRNRLLQTSPELVGFFDAGVTEEAGITYTMRLYNAADVLLDEDTGITGTSHSMTPPVSSGTYTLELAAVRDSLEQYYALRHTFDFTAALPDDVLATSILGKLRHYYPMSETSGTVLKDLHGGADMTLLNTGNITYNGTTLRAGASYGAMRFTSTARASINGNPLFLTEQDDFSLFAWYKPDAATGVQRFLTCNAPASDATESHNITARCGFDTNGLPEWFWEHGVGTNDSVTGFGTAAITASAQAVAFVRDAALKTVTQYLNNAAAGTTSYSDNPTGGTHVDNEFTIGNDEDQSRAVAGYLQDMMFFAEPLTLDEVVYLHNSGNGKSYADIVDDATLDYLWTPSQLNDKALWVISDHADNVIASGKATKLNNLTGLGGGTIYTGNGAKHGTTTLNGRPVLTADGTDTGEYEFLMTTRATMNMNGITIAAVHKMRTADGGSPTLKVLVGVNRAGGTAGIRADLSNSSSSVSNNVRMGGRRLDADTYASVHDNTNHSTNWCITVGNNNYSTGVGSIHVDGVQLVSTAAVYGTGSSSNTQPTNGIMLGRYISGNTHANYELAEVLVIRGNLGSTDRQKLEGYLAHKWGLTANLDVAHPYKTDPPLV